MKETWKSGVGEWEMDHGSWLYQSRKTFNANAANKLQKISGINLCAACAFQFRDDFACHSLASFDKPIRHPLLKIPCSTAHCMNFQTGLRQKQGKIGGSGLDIYAVLCNRIESVNIHYAKGMKSAIMSCLAWPSMLRPQAEENGYTVKRTDSNFLSIPYQ